MEQDSKGDDPMQSDVDKLRQQILELKADLQELGALARGAAREKMHEAEDAMHGYIEDGRERVEEYEEWITDHVRAKPMQSVLISIGIGYVLSLLLRRR